MSFKILSLDARLELRRQLCSLSNEDICNRVAAFFPEVFISLHAHNRIAMPPGHEPIDIMQSFQLLILGNGQEAYRLFYDTKKTHKQNRTEFEAWKTSLREHGLIP